MSKMSRVIVNTICFCVIYLLQMLTCYRQILFLANISNLLKKPSVIAAIEKIVCMLKPVASNFNIGLHWFKSEGAFVAAISDVDERCLQRQGHWKSVSNKIPYKQNSIGKRLSNITNNRFVSS